MALVALVSGSGCGSVAGPSRSVPVGRPFELRVGETVAVQDELLVLTFDRVSEDSRCPLGVLCIRAGDAQVELTAVRLPDHRQAVLLYAGAERRPDTATVEDFTLRLVELDPLQRMDRPIAPSDYVATLVVSR